MNMYLVRSILNEQHAHEQAQQHHHSALNNDDDMQVMLFDRFSDGPYHELIQKAFSPNHPVLRHTHYKGKVSP